MAKKKKQSVYEVHNQLFWQEQQFASLVSDRFEGVSSVTVGFTFKPEAEWMGTPSPQSQKFTSRDKAVWRQ